MDEIEVIFVSKSSQLWVLMNPLKSFYYGYMKLYEVIRFMRIHGDLTWFNMV